MTHQPRTQRSDNDEITGKPCIHFTDTENLGLQFHVRPDAPGIYVSISWAAQLGPFLVPQRVSADLTPGQVNELMSYLRETV